MGISIKKVRELNRAIKIYNARIVMTEEEKQMYLNYDLSIVIIKETLTGAYNCTEQNTKRITRYEKFEDLPEKIRQPLSIVRMLEDEHTVVSVGRKLKAGLYWVYVWE